jgi:hypothetical protein
MRYLPEKPKLASTRRSVSSHVPGPEGGYEFISVRSRLSLDFVPRKETTGLSRCVVKEIVMFDYTDVDADGKVG